jgi:fucose permease
VSLIQVLIAIVIACSLPLWKVNRQKNQEEVDTKPIGLVGAIKIKGVPEIIIAFMAYCACESTAMLWTSSYFESAYQMSKEGAAALGSIFFIGMTFGRFMSGFFADKLGDFKMIKLGAVIAFAGIILTAVPIQSVAMAGFIITGLGCAPIYPCIIHTTPVRFGKEKSQSIIGVQMASAYFGATFMPPLFGILANAISFKLMPAFTGGFMLLMFLMIRKTERDTVSL